MPSNSGVETRAAPSTEGSKVRELTRLARPQHWVKNVIILLPVIFAVRMADPAAWLAAGLTVMAFCFASSAIYAINDIRDRAVDRLHPLKRHRPVASGRLSPTVAIAFALVSMSIGVLIAAVVNAGVAVVLVLYLMLQFAYTFELKHRTIVDVICIALGFVFRAIGGALAIRVEPSPWLVICAFTLCLFMGACKRWNEIAAAGSCEMAAVCRKTLYAYQPEFLTHLVTLSAGLAIVSYLLYAAHPTTVERFGTDALLYTLPFVIYGVCRFAMVSMQARYSDPVTVLLKDRPLMVTAVAWALSIAFITTMGARIQAQVWIRP